MATQEELKNKVATTKPPSDIRDMIQRSVKELGKALPSHMNAERLVRIALTTLRVNPRLYDCTPESFLGALFQSAQLGLEPNIEGQAYIIPFNNKRKIGNEWKTFKEAQFLVGYKGYVELFFRHQSSSSLSMEVVREGDKFEYALGTDSFLNHIPAMKNRGSVIGYYAVAKLKEGATVFKFISKEECMEHGKSFSKCYDEKSGKFYEGTPWEKNPDAMCLKTVLVQLMKLLPKSIEIQRALSMDETIKTKVAVDMVEVPDAAEWNEKKEEKPIEVLGVASKSGEEVPRRVDNTPREDGELFAPELISKGEAMTLKVMAKDVQPKLMSYLKNTFGVDKVEKIQKIWFADICYWTKNYANMVGPKDPIKE